MISNDYSDIFNEVSALLGERIHYQAEFIDSCMKESNSVSYDYITLTADNLCAYNEIFSCPQFVHIRPFLSY